MVSRQALGFCVAFAVLLWGCASGSAAGVHEVAVNEYVFGAFGGRGLDVRDVCGETPAARIEIRRRALDYVVSVVTLGVYVPHRIRVQCARSPA